MRTCRTIALTVLGLALLWSAPASSAPPLGAADGWYKWQVDNAETTLFLYQEKGKPTRIRTVGPDCRISWGRSDGISGEVTDMGVLSLDDSVALLLDIASAEDLDLDVRQEALFGLAQSDSDAAFAYLDQLLFVQKK
jgi:hypothetical protein